MEAAAWRLTVTEWDSPEGVDKARVASYVSDTKSASFVRTIDHKFMNDWKHFCSHIERRYTLTPKKVAAAIDVVSQMYLVKSGLSSKKSVLSEMKKVAPILTPENLDLLCYNFCNYVGVFEEENHDFSIFTQGKKRHKERCDILSCMGITLEYNLLVAKMEVFQREQLIALRRLGIGNISADVIKAIQQRAEPLSQKDYSFIESIRGDSLVNYNLSELIGASSEKLLLARTLKDLGVSITTHVFSAIQERVEPLSTDNLFLIKGIQDFNKVNMSNSYKKDSEPVRHAEINLNTLIASRTTPLMDEDFAFIKECTGGSDVYWGWVKFPFETRQQIKAFKDIICCFSTCIYEILATRITPFSTDTLSAIKAVSEYANNRDNLGIDKAVGILFKETMKLSLSGEDKILINALLGWDLF